MRFFYLFFLFAFFTTLYPADDLLYWVKSHQWDKVTDYFRGRAPSKESEVFTLIEMHDKAPEGDKEKRFRYMISLVRGVFVTDSSPDEIRKILTQTMPFQTTLFRITYWKLYSEIVNRDYLTIEERIDLLNRLTWDEDPVSRRAFDEMIRLLASKNYWEKIPERVNSLPESYRTYLITGETHYRLGKAYYMLGDEKKCIEEWITLLQRDDVQESTIQSLLADWRKWKGENSPEKFPLPELSLILPGLSNSDKEEVLRRRSELLNSRLPHYKGFKNLSLVLAKADKFDELQRIYKNNRNYAEMDPGFAIQLAEIFIQQNKYQRAQDFVKQYGIRDNNAFRILALTNEKLGVKDEYFKSLVQYLSKNPFNLFYQDRLLEFLVRRNEERINYQDLTYFEKAIQEIPNLPVKGRLIYWYLRALQDKGDTETLKKELTKYYAYCPGSYYTRVIREEFFSIIKEIKTNSNPTGSKDALFEYLSYTAGIPEESESILGKNLGFAFFPGAFDLGVRLQSSGNRVNSIRTLQIASEYFKVGEDNLGISLVNQYAQRERLSEAEKEEILVGIGDVSGNTYYTAYYTRSLLKRLMIPDDPILLPTTVSSRIYPRPHRDLVQKYSDQNGISEDMVFALMRQESFFKETATSRTNARGLMQIMPATGNELASKLGLESYTLYNAHTSIQLGTKFLAYLLKSNENQLRWASIAYNGGPGNLRKWKRMVYRGDFNHFLEDLPVKESRDYCRIVVSNYYAYDIMKKYHKL